MLEGLHISKVDKIGSACQPGPLDLDDDDEAPWQIDWKAGPDGAANQEVVAWWVKEVMKSQKMKDLYETGIITQSQFSEHYVRSLLIHSFDTAQKHICINQDESGERRERTLAAKDKSKQKQRQKDREAAEGQLWRDLPIPEWLFIPKYHSDSESNPTPDLSGLLEAITLERYKKLRNGADYEMLTPGWRNKEVTEFYHALNKRHKSPMNYKTNLTHRFNNRMQDTKLKSVPLTQMLRLEPNVPNLPPYNTYVMQKT
ncbi:hypothetical protein FRC10_002708 [Ceratobasidium sp. 414]|nr:hypothetical protein FRC10_002708 [Ceratobasidium sp. 414]